MFAPALIHTFSAKFVEHLAHTRPAHAGLSHLLGGLQVVITLLQGPAAATSGVDPRNHTELAAPFWFL